jgi:hypothetical protein
MRNSKDDAGFEDLGFEGQEEFFDDEDFESYTPIDLSDEDDPIELERRKSRYASLRKSDKIFNNSYNMGQTNSSEDDVRASNNIKVDISSPHYHLYDRDHYSDHIDNTITQYDIDKYVSSSDEIRAILENKEDKRKFNKVEINELFRIITAGVKIGEHASFFVSPIHVLDTISSLTNMEYKKLFDMLGYDFKETLLLELNKKYGFLDKPSKNLKMF